MRADKKVEVEIEIRDAEAGRRGLDKDEIEGLPKSVSGHFREPIAQHVSFAL